MDPPRSNVSLAPNTQITTGVAAQRALLDVVAEQWGGAVVPLCSSGAQLLENFPDMVDGLSGGGLVASGELHYVRESPLCLVHERLYLIVVHPAS